MSRPLPPREFARDPLDPHPVPTGWTNEHARVFAASLLVPLFILAVGVQKMQLMAPLVDPGVPCRARSAADPTVCVDADWRCAVLKLANPARDAAPDPALGLRFIHVPKTGGTGIGVADAHFEDRERKKKVSFSRDGASCRCSSWHVPPRHRPWAATVFGGGERSFCVVRDPLARLLSEFRFRPGQHNRAKFPTSKAPISAVVHSFRLTFGRAIISRNGLEAWMLFPERERGTLTLKRH